MKEIHQMALFCRNCFQSIEHEEVLARNGHPHYCSVACERQAEHAVQAREVAEAVADEMLRLMRETIEAVVLRHF